MTTGRVLAALVGFAGGAAVVVATLALELMARDMSVRGGLSELQMRSVAVWVLESLPFVIALAAYQMPLAPSAPAPVSAPATAPPPPPPPPVPEQAADARAASSSGSPAEAPPPPPLPETLRSASVLGVALEPQVPVNQRIQALQELVKVLRANASRTAAESRAKSEYLASMSQELRTPLNAITAYAQRLLDAAGQGEVEADLWRINREAHRLVELLNNILDLSKIEVGHLSIVLEDVDLAQVVDEAQVAIAPFLPATGGAGVLADIRPGGRFARGDHMRVRQILVNLMAHVLKGSPDQSSVEVTVEPTRADAGGVVVRVRDRRALSRDQVDDLFSEYHQNNVSSMGLALAVSRKMAELMGGALEVETERGKGSVFILRLAPGHTEEASVKPRSTIALNERLSGLSLTLVDHDPSGSALARYLERAGLIVNFVASDTPALQALEEQPAHIVIIDAGVDGAWEATERAIDQGSQVVVLSLRDEDVEPALQLGVTAFLPRPVERRLVLATLERCLDD